MGYRTIEVHNCPHGLGAFAARSYAQGEIIAIISGGKLTSQPGDWKHSLEMHSGVWWEAFSKDQEGYWSNFIDHSDSPNCDFVDFDKKIPSAKVIALREITGGEELFMDYDRFPIERRLK
jgi:SET domain-containing protein